MKNLAGYEGLNREGLNYYFIEVIEYQTQAACRILVTPYNYPHLRKYDPYKIGGPFFSKEKQKNYFLKRIRNHEGKFIPNIVEFMKEPYYPFKDCWVRNHALTICGCIGPRKGVMAFERTHANKLLQFCLGVLGHKGTIFKMIPKIKSREENKTYFLQLLEDLHAQATTAELEDGQSQSKNEQPNSKNCSLERSVLNVLKNKQNPFLHIVALLRNIRERTNVNFEKVMERDMTGYIKRLLDYTAEFLMDFSSEDSLHVWYKNMLDFIPEKYQKEVPKLLSDLIDTYDVFDRDYYTCEA